MADARRGFGPVVVTGLVTAGLLTVASAKPWIELPVDYGMMPGVPEPDTRADMPVALALSLVVLAGWGALLVTRGRARRLVATLALVAGLGVLAAVIAAPFVLPDQIRDRLAGAEDITAQPTGWYVVAAVAAVLALPALLLAWRLVPSWPEMGSRYDAPGSASAQEVDTDDPRALWKALDEGSDPTDPPTDPPGERRVP